MDSFDFDDIYDTFCEDVEILPSPPLMFETDDIDFDARSAQRHIELDDLDSLDDLSPLPTSLYLDERIAQRQIEPLDDQDLIDIEIQRQIDPDDLDKQDTADIIPDDSDHDVLDYHFYDLDRPDHYFYDLVGPGIIGGSDELMGRTSDLDGMDDLDEPGYYFYELVGPGIIGELMGRTTDLD